MFSRMVILARRHLALITLLLITMLTGILTPAAAQAQQRCFQETGFCISGAIRSYWERNGGLAVFGYPITAQRVETVEGAWTGPVQWFERDRLEDHSNEGKGILAGRLGAQILELRGTPWQSFPQVDEADSPVRCSYYPQTRHSLCDRFETYWAEHGGLARFGYPITEPFEEEVEGHRYMVQYFERRRMEYHPELAGTRYEVLLGLLGRDVYNAPQSRGTEYSSPDGAWSVHYPADLLKVEQLDVNTTLFISADRSTFVAIDSYYDQGNAYGNTGEGLRNRARDTLKRIYGRDITETGINGPGNSWETGISYTSGRGSQGAALYEQRGREQGNYRVHGFLYGHRSSNAAVLPQLLSVGQSFAPTADTAQVLIGFFKTLNQGRYGEAAAIYGGSYDQLRAWNPTVNPNETFTLWQRGCTINGLVCLPTRRVIDTQLIADGQVLVTVELSQADGQPFQRNGQTAFGFTVKLINGSWRVMDMPPYLQ